jgi:hypothetical protein
VLTALDYNSGSKISEFLVLVVILKVHGVSHSRTFS